MLNALLRRFHWWLRALMQVFPPTQPLTVAPRKREPMTRSAEA
jgi:hypothetical protein